MLRGCVCASTSLPVRQLQGDCRGATCRKQQLPSPECVLALQPAHGRTTSLPVTAAGAFLMTQTCLPHMPPGDAAIIHISSTRAHQVPLRLWLLLLGFCHVVGSLDGTLLTPETQQGLFCRGPTQPYCANCVHRALSHRARHTPRPTQRPKPVCWA